ncbi:MAG: carboxypeptidase-like regulatory domain-containing protein [Terriglobales bacterium]
MIRFVTSGIVVRALCGSFAAAQLFPGRITGTVRDAQGPAVPGATIKLSNPATGQERTLASDQNGEFNFPELPLGTFRLTVSKAGFRTTVISDIVTSQGQVNISANAGADSGQNSGSVMNVIIRSGTNQIHGSVYELHRDAALDASNFLEYLASPAGFEPALPP